jgi:hypothetical protein
MGRGSVAGSVVQRVCGDLARDHGGHGQFLRLRLLVCCSLNTANKVGVGDGGVGAGGTEEI